MGSGRCRYDASTHRLMHSASTPRRRVRHIVPFVAALAVACAGTSSGGQTAQVLPGAPPDPATARPFKVTTAKETFVDRSRSTKPSGRSAAPGRSLATTVYVPDGDGPFPLIVFSHGMNGHPDKFTELLTVWAQAGYVIAAPAFPLTNDRVPDATGNIPDINNQPGDVSFVIDEMLRLNREPNSRVHGRIDPDRVGVGGLSLGGATTYGVAFNDCCRDDRVKAVEILAGALIVGGEHELDGHVPMLLVHGDKDPALSYQLATDIYAKAAAPVWFVTLIGALHADPFENDDTRYDALVERLTTDFWDATLGEDAAAFDRLEKAAVVEGLSTLQSRR
jgi:dienelactone hydrolase